MKCIEITKESHFDSIEFRDDWWADSIWLWLWCVENDISRWRKYSMMDLYIKFNFNYMIVSTIYKYFPLVRALFHTGRNFTCIVLFWNYFIEKEHDKWLKNTTKPFFCIRNTFWPHPSNSIFEIECKKIGNKNGMGCNENEATSLSTLLRKTAQHNVYVIMDRF